MAHKKHRAPRTPAAGSGRPANRTPPAGTVRAAKPQARPRKTRKGLIFGLAGAALLAGAIGVFLSTRPKPIPIRRDPRLNVILVTLDTTRADRLGCYGYTAGRTPNLDVLAEGGVRFSKAYSQVPLTLPSHTSIMTGEYPSAHGVHNNGTYALGAGTPTLAEILKGRGYKTAAFTASFSVDSRFGLNRGFDVYDDHLQADSPFKSANAERRAEEVFQAFEPWFDKNAGGDAPFFVWIHFFDPHLPYNPPSPFREQCGDRLYDGEVSYMDAIFGLVMRKLVSRKLLTSTLVVAAGDHGESFGEKGESGHGIFLYEPAIHVPQIVFAEGRLPAGEVIPSRVRLIDIMPTVLDLTETPVPPNVQGQSLVPYIQKKKSGDLENMLETFYPRENFGWAALTGLMADQWKYIHAPTDELYDLLRDPGEIENKAAGNRTAEKLKARLESSLKSGAGPVKAGRVLTEEEKTRLRSLGYVDYADPKARSSSADPKDRVGELKMIQDAEKFEYEGRFAEAAELHARMLALRPDAASSYINLALVQARLKKFEEAVVTLKKGLERIPDSEPLLTRLGFTYLFMSRPEQALSAMGDVLKINPRAIDALSASGIILEGLKRKDEARGFFERALAIEPGNKFIRGALAGNLAGQGRLSEAVPLYVRLTEDFPRDPTPYRLLGIAYGLLGEEDKAAEALQKYLDHAGNEPPQMVEQMRQELQRIKTRLR